LPGDPRIVREAILGGAVVVVKGEDDRIRGVIDERSGLETKGYIVVDPGQAFDDGSARHRRGGRAARAGRTK